MNQIIISIDKELFYQSSRSGGKGGQNVNKVETRIEARWDVANSQLINEEQKKRIFLKLANQISKEGFLMVQCSSTRSQLENKQIAIEKINALVNKALQMAKKRGVTKTPKSAIEKRLSSKKINAEKKSMRRKDFE